MITLQEFIKSPNNYSSCIFTLSKPLADAYPISEEVLKKEIEKNGSLYLFFMIKPFPLKRWKSDSNNCQKEIAITLLDISEKILLDSAKSEKKYMTYMNSTISHEMRNPLNSISSQLQFLSSMINEFGELGESLRDKLERPQYKQVK